MRRFFADPDALKDGTVCFDGEQSRHISRVLRLEKGEHVLVSDGTGRTLECELCSVGASCTARVIAATDEDEEKHEVVLFQAVIKNEKMDLAVQKATELGISRIVPVTCERSVVKTDEKSEKKRERWQKIAQEACKQCGRSRFPAVDAPMDFAAAAGLFFSFELPLFCYEDEHTVSITEAVHEAARVAYFIGPEGGFTEKEHEALVHGGAVSVTLGKRILRAETAAIAAGAVIMALLGEMDG